MKDVFTKFVTKSVPMKLSVPGYIFLLSLLCLPLIMSGKKASHPGEPAEYKRLLPLGVSHHNSHLFSESETVYQDLGLASAGLPKEAFDQAMKGFDRLMEKGLLAPDSILTIVDFTKSSSQKRMYVLDLKTRELLFHTVVAHGRNSGAEYARSFSNTPRSNKSSLGFYVTRGTYHGSNGYSLKLDGMEAGFNDRAMARAIVIHGANYANEGVVTSKGYLGRSLGCPALPVKSNKAIIDRIKQGQALFIYFPDRHYQSGSKLLNG